MTALDDYSLSMLKDTGFQSFLHLTKSDYGTQNAEGYYCYEQQDLISAYTG